MKQSLSVIFLNNTVPNCGVYQYGLRLKSVLQNSALDFSYKEISSLEGFKKIKNKPKVIIFNYIACGRTNGPLGWLNNHIIDNLKADGHIIGVIGHLFDVRLDFDFILSQDPNLNDDEQDKIFSIPRPLIFHYENCPFNVQKVVVDTQEKVKIGSFGLGAESKCFPKVIELVNQQFKEAIIHLNISNSDYSDSDGSTRDRIVTQCLNIPVKKGIQLEITKNFMDELELIDFLNQNDLNIFAYNNDINDGGIASVIDYAVSARKPFAVSQSFMFRHVDPKIHCYENNTLQEIMINSLPSIDTYLFE